MRQSEPGEACLRPSATRIFLRSLVFNVAFYAALIGLALLGLPLLLTTRKAVLRLARLWGRVSLWLLERICDLKVEFRGLEHLMHGGYVVAPKHQSVWETFALLTVFDDFSFVLKRELTFIPVFGWYCLKADQIAINRAKGSSILAGLTERVREVLAEGRQLLIFPEGTRRPIGAPPLYKYGIAHLCCETGAVCLPVALNSGLFWPRRSFLRQPGTVLVEFLAPIAPGHDKTAFLDLLRERMEKATRLLIDESLARDPQLRERLPQEFQASVA
jgi:1-acyl-sn-glycerol-3-phosphate acyltransferase